MPDGRGSLEGIVLDRQLQLSKPFRLSSDSPFQPPADGQLYLRCQDSWAELSDNEGSIVVAIRPAR